MRKKIKYLITKLCPRMKIIGIILLIGIIFLNNISLKNVSAKSYNKISDHKKTYVFAVPEGGWSSIMVWVRYMERFTKKADSKNKFYNRELFYAYRTAYATERPSFAIGKVKHINGEGKILHTFKVWKRCDSMSDGSWDYFCSRKNETNKYYRNTTKNKAQVSYSTYCRGANIPSRGNTVKLNLNTN